MCKKVLICNYSMYAHTVQDILVAVSPAKKVAFSAKISTSGFWPKQQISNIIFPPEMQSIKVVTSYAHFHLLFVILAYILTYTYIYIYLHKWL